MRLDRFQSHSSPLAPLEALAQTEVFARRKEPQWSRQLAIWLVHDKKQNTFQPQSTSLLSIRIFSTISLERPKVCPCCGASQRYQRALTEVQTDLRGDFNMNLVKKNKLTRKIATYTKSLLETSNQNKHALQKISLSFQQLTRALLSLFFSNLFALLLLPVISRIYQYC